MSPAEHRTLTELVVQFRHRAETADSISRGYAGKVKETSGPDRDDCLRGEARTRGKASAYAADANELERALNQTDTAQHKSTLHADPEPPS